METSEGKLERALLTLGSEYDRLFPGNPEQLLGHLKANVASRARPHRPGSQRWWLAAAAVFVLFAASGAFVELQRAYQRADAYATPVPRQFWHDVLEMKLPSTYTEIFPRKSGQRSCEIPVGHPAPHTPRFLQGTCSTRVVSRSDYLALLPPSAGVFRSHSGALPAKAVVLTESWPGPWFQTEVARWIFPIDASGRTMGMEYVGHPPQFSK